MIQRISLFLLLGSFLYGGSVRAEEKALSYPELEVTPRASERLHMEADKENSYRWRDHLPVQLSAAATLYAGIASNNQYKDGATQNDIDANHVASAVAMGVGGLFLLTTVYLDATYSPYQDGWANVSKMPAGNEREKLTRERVAEEDLVKPSNLAMKIEWLSFISNLGANAYLLGNVTQNQKLPATLGATLSFAPLFFGYHWSEVWETHQLYKKKIYGPVASAMLIPDGRGGVTPGGGWFYQF